jgi:flagellar biosynthesis chaperone FliJ
VSSKKVQTLALLQRIRRLELEKEAATLGEIRQEQATLERQREGRVKDLQRDTTQVSVEQAAYVGFYIKAVQKDLVRIDKGLDSLANVANRQERIVSGKFSAMKTVDMVLDRTKTNELEEIEKKERSQIEDLSVMRFKRKSRL